MENEDIENKDGFYITVNLAGSQPQTAGNYGAFFTAYHPCEVLQVTEVHTVISNDNATLDIEKLTGTTALDSGNSILKAVYDLTSTANTIIRKRGIDLSSYRTLKHGDRLALKDAGNLTAIEGIQITLYIKFLNRGSYR